jgi:peptide/nickel transport system permease protein
MSDARGPWIALVERLRRRRTNCAAFAVLAAIATCAIYAPLIASDRALYVSPDPVTSYPLFAALSRADVLAMTLWPFALASVVLLARRRRARAIASTGLVVSLALVLAWPFLFASHPEVVVSSKFELGQRREAAQHALFPPVAFGYAETHMTEIFRPPTWAPASEIDEQGNYARGPRRLVRDPATGFMPALAPVEVRVGEPERNSALRHPLGTDSLGRDLLARLLWGARSTLAVAFLAASLALAIGVAVGALAGWFGGWVDSVLARVIEVVQAFPALFLIVVVAATLSARSQGPGVMVAVVALVGWTGIARLVRAEFVRLRPLPFVEAARALGFSDARILARHVLPNALGPVLVSAAFLVGWSTMVESAVSFLGFGVQQPTPSWGSLIQESRALEHWWILVFPGVAIAATVIALHTLGEGLRDALDPRQPE